MTIQFFIFAISSQITLFLQRVTVKLTEITLLLKSLEILHRIAVKYAKQRVHDHYLRKHGSSTDTDQEPLEVKYNTGCAVVHHILSSNEIDFISN